MRIGWIVFVVLACLPVFTPAIAQEIEDSTFDGTFTRHYITLDTGIRMHYVIGGSGDPVVLVHGWPQTWAEWREIMPTLAEQYTVIAIDMRGAGESDKPLTGYDKATLAGDIYALITALGYDSVHYVGHDIGGMVGYAYAHDYPQATRSLTILDVPLPGIEPFWSMIIADPRSWHFAFHAVPDVPEALVFGQERLYIEHFIEGFLYNPEAFSDEDYQLFADAYAQPGAMRAGFEYYRAFPQDIEQNAIYAQTPLEMPVLALGGEFGSGAIMQPMLESVANNVTGGIIEQSGHWLSEEQPEILLERLLAFLGGVQ